MLILPGREVEGSLSSLRSGDAGTSSNTGEERDTDSANHILVVKTDADFGSVID